MGLSASVLGDELGSALGDDLGDVFGVVNMKTIAGDTLRLYYEGDSYVTGALGIPDAVTLTNTQGNTTYDVTQSVSSKQPHAEGVLGLRSFVFNSAAARESKALGGTPYVAEVGDAMAFLVVLKLADLTGNNPVMEVGVTTTSSGMNIYTSGSTIRVQVVNMYAQAAFTDTSAFHVVTGWVDADGVHVRVDGGSTVTNGTPTGVTNNLSGVVLGNTLSNFTYGDVSLARVAVLQNASQSIIDDAEAYLIANPGVPS